MDVQIDQKPDCTLDNQPISMAIQQRRRDTADNVRKFMSTYIWSCLMNVWGSNKTRGVMPCWWRCERWKHLFEGFGHKDYIRIVLIPVDYSCVNFHIKSFGSGCVRYGQIKKIWRKKANHPPVHIKKDNIMLNPVLVWDLGNNEYWSCSHSITWKQVSKLVIMCEYSLRGSWIMR